VLGLHGMVLGADAEVHATLAALTDH
jgi:hypothetical protein